jgi:NAD+ synthase
MNVLSLINPQKEKKTIGEFLKRTFHEQKIQNAVIGLSGGVDSTTCLYLLKAALPEKNIIAVHLPYEKPSSFIPKNIPVISIKKPVDVMTEAKNADLRKCHAWLPTRDTPSTPTSLMHFRKDAFEPLDNIRLGNIMARVRMIILFDLAKKHNALVCGTENKTEHLLGYYTRFGDEASDIEPIRHLYKTQVCQLAKYLGVPDEIINQKPTAGLWSGQTDEGEFGFSYEEADNVLHLYFDKKISTEKIIKMGYPHAKEILAFVKKNQFKRKTPYSLPKSLQSLKRKSREKK